MRTRTVLYMAVGAGSALALAALGAWLSEGASRSMTLEATSNSRLADTPSSTFAVTTVPEPASPLPPARAVPTRPLAAPALPDEAALMAELRQLAASDPARAVELARAGNRRFPESADAPERASITVHALAARGLASEARGEAEDMVNRYPDSNWVREVEQFTGAHRHRNLRLNAAGQLEYE